MTWSLSIYGQVVSVGDCQALAGSPDVVNCATLHQLVWKIDSLNICPGHPDEQFVKMAASRGGNFHAVSGELSIPIDSTMVAVYCSLVQHIVSIAALLI